MADGNENPRLSFRGGEIVQRRAPNTQVIMTATPRQVVGGEIVTLTWGVTEGSAEIHDWLGLFSENDEKKPLRHCYVKYNKRGGEWSVEAPREAGKYVFRFIKSLFPYDLIHKDYLGLARSNVWEVVQPGANALEGERLTQSDALSLSNDAASAVGVLGAHVNAASSPTAANPETGTSFSSGWSAASSSPLGASNWIGQSPSGRSGRSGHVRSGSGGSSSLLGEKLATHVEAMVGGGRLREHTLTWLMRQFASDDELAGVKLEDVVEMSHQVEDEVQARVLAKRLAAAAEQPGPGRRAVMDAGGVGALLHLAHQWSDPDIQRHAAHGLHSLVTYVPTLHGGMHDAQRRVLTFSSHFPHQKEPLTPAVMAQTGFYSQPLEPGSDRVICIVCGVIVEGWLEGEVPGQVHANMSPHCRLLTWPNVPSITTELAASSHSEADLETVATAGSMQRGTEGHMAVDTASAVPATASTPLGRAWGWDSGNATQQQVLVPVLPTENGNGHEDERYEAHQARGLPSLDSGSGQIHKVDSSKSDVADVHPPMTPPRREHGDGVLGTLDDEAGGVGVLEIRAAASSSLQRPVSLGAHTNHGGAGDTQSQVMDRSVARELLESAEAEQALLALNMSTDKAVQAWWFRLMSALAHSAGHTKEFQSMCLPRLLVAVATCKDEGRLLHLLEALRWLALQPSCRYYLTSGAGVDTLSVLINALPKWSARNLEVAERNGGTPSDIWPRLLENAMCVLQHTLQNVVLMPRGATAAVLCVLREAPYEHSEVLRSTVACLHSLADACDPTRPAVLRQRGHTVHRSSPTKQGTPTKQSTPTKHGTPLPNASPYANNASPYANTNPLAPVPGGGSARDIRDITTCTTVRRLVELMLRGGDLHLRTLTARLLGSLIIQRPSVCLEIACVGIAGNESRCWSEDTSPEQNVPHIVKMLSGAGAVDGITALLWLARDTGVARGQVATTLSGSSDVLSQRMVARCLEAISLTCHMDPKMKLQLMDMGFKDSEAGQALRMGGGTLECAVTWLAGREETPGGPEDEFEMVEDSPVDLPTLMMSSGGLDCMAEMLQERDSQVKSSLWKAIAALSRVGPRCDRLLRSKVGTDWIIPQVAGWAGGGEIMLGSDRIEDCHMHMQGLAGAGGSARDSVGSCILEVVANLAAEAETCRQLLKCGIILFLASAACAARSSDVVGARTCARGLYYILMNSTLHAEEEQWWPSDAGISGGTAALMHLCLITNDKGVQRWTGMALHRLCLSASPSLVDRIILNRGVQSMLQLVYSRVVEISSYAFSTLALLSSTESKSSRRALFQAGVMFPVTKLVRNGPLDTKLAAAHILANLVKDDSILDDMLSTGCDDCLEVAFYLLSLPPSGDWVGSAARRDGRLIAASASSQSLSPSQDEALIEIIQRSLEVLQAVCLHQRHQPRFLMLTGLQVLGRLSQSVACNEHASIARAIAKILEVLSNNAALRQALKDGQVKEVVKKMFKRHEDGQIEACMENILVNLAAVNLSHTPGRNLRSANPSLHVSSLDTFEDLSSAHKGGAQVVWRVSCQRTMASGEQEQWVFSVSEVLTYVRVHERVCGKFGPSVVMTFQDEDEAWKVISGDEMLQHAMSLHRAVRKRKLHIQVTLITPLWEHADAKGAQEMVDPERNPGVGDDEADLLLRCSSATYTPVKEAGHKAALMMSRLCDSSPSFQQHGDGREGPTLRWRLGKLIGEGAYAKVYEGLNADSGEMMAIKQVSLLGGHEDEKKRKEALTALQREIEVMKLLQHENIVKYLGTETTDGRLNIFLEYVSGGSIAHVISNFGCLDEPVVRKYTRQIIVGLQFLHDKGIVHCDIKGGNILVTEGGIIKLADFNCSKKLTHIAGGGSNPLRSLLGTPQFMAPEVIRQTGHGKKADIWSVGCTLVQMLTGAPPWDEISNKITLMFHIASCKQPPSPPDDISDDAKDFLRLVLQIDPRDRPACQDLLLHPFCANHREISGSAVAPAASSSPLALNSLALTVNSLEAGPQVHS